MGWWCGRWNLRSCNLGGSSVTDMLKLSRRVFFLALVATSLGAVSGAQAAITEEEAQAIGVDAYLYF